MQYLTVVQNKRDRRNNIDGRPEHFEGVMQSAFAKRDRNHPRMASLARASLLEYSTVLLPLRGSVSPA
ncbi:MAG: hypothetical protein J0I13_13020 [Rhizobiales bacterium]|jgi:hypothetical protein|nr:hypothetical protein [Hyphomicrobiales bacterium]